MMRMEKDNHHRKSINKIFIVSTGSRVSQEVHVSLYILTFEYLAAISQLYEFVFLSVRK
jgi:hypothetical protein